MNATYDDLVRLDESRDIFAELELADAEMMAGTKAKVTYVEISEAVQARQALGMTQDSFAELLGISVRTLQEWEQSRRKPSKSAQMLLKIAIQHPETLKAISVS